MIEFKGQLTARYPTNQELLLVVYGIVSAERKAEK
jgi:hypothetical protein